MSDPTKPPCNLVPLAGLPRLARVMAAGLRDGRKPGDWQGMTAEDFRHARLRHLVAAQNGDTSEDHEAAATVCGLIIMWFEEHGDS